MIERQRMPVLPLRGMVVFPYMIVHLDASQERIVAGLERAMESDKRVLLCAQKNVDVEEPGGKDLYRIGTVAEVRHILKMPDGSFRVLVEGKFRGSIKRYLACEDYLNVEVEIHRDKIDKSLEMEALARGVVSQFEQWVKLSQRMPPEARIEVQLIDDFGRLADMIAAHLNLKLDVKQEMLEKIDVKSRFEHLYVLLARELKIADVEHKIGVRVQEQIEQFQKEAYLREQVKAIQEELGDGDGRLASIADYKKRMETTKYPEDVTAAIEREIHHLEGISPYSPETGIIKTYIEWLLDLPWCVSNMLQVDLRKAAKILDHDHYGLKKVKDRILDYLAVCQLSQEQVEGDGNARRQMKAPILCLVGPPGVGKTSLAASVARAMGRKFVRASLGGVRDEAEIRGHRRTYVGSLPGRIMDGLRRAGANNPVFLLDEIDKLSYSYQGDPASALIEVLDPAQNHTFTDHYIDLPFDLTQVFWIVTANDLSTVPPALRDRMEVIALSSYTEEEKLNIARKYLLPRQMAENSLPPKSLKLAKDALQRIIGEYTKEAGVRELERALGKLCRKVARRLLDGRADRVDVTARQLEDFLERPRFLHTETEKAPRVGLVTGMAWTEAGGEILPTEAAVLKGKGHLLLTGKLGDVMQESAKAALSFIRSRADKLNLPGNFYEKFDLHIHLPEGAIPKDGPSAGITMATAMISALTNKTVPQDLAMTGEITLRGRVLPIGGLKEKVMSAYREGIKTVLLPKENERDLEDLPKSVRDKMTFVSVSTMDDVIDQVWPR